MKNSIAFLLAALSFNSLISCMPQDREVVSADQRGKLLSQRSGGGGDGTTVKLGSYGLGAFLVEKQGEILQLLALSAVNSGEARGGFTLTETTSRTGDVRFLNLDANNTSISHKGFVTTQNAVWDFGMVTLPSALSFNGSVSNSSLQTQNTLADKTFQSALFQETLAKITATPLPDGSGHQISYQSSGLLTLTLAGVTEAMPCTLKIDFQTDLTNLQADQLKVVNSVAQIHLTRKFPFADVRVISSGGLSFVNKADCPRMVGTASLDSDKKKLAITFTDTNVIIGPSYNLPSGDCGARPLVDLNRVLTFQTK
jgi:hypothetical protein